MVDPQGEVTTLEKTVLAVVSDIAFDRCRSAKPTGTEGPMAHSVRHHVSASALRQEERVAFHMPCSAVGRGRYLGVQ